MNTRTSFGNLVLSAAVLLGAMVLSACGGNRALRVQEKEVPLTQRYSKLVFQDFEIDPKLATDYPKAVSECESSAMSALISKRLFDTVTKAKAGANYKNALLLKGSVVNMRIVSGGARLWLGAMVGSSDMSVQLTLTDAATGEVVREKLLSTANNAMGAAWTMGSSDRTLPSDMGRIIAEYIGAIIP
ncbi:MAG: DUF4410 domain-containing protein [Elusimicrobia bacterium]|nr:DUF4410 domain-containing protein [Elusimicrobiota bacterium]